MDENKANLKRRHFLVTLGAGGAGAAAAVAAVAGKGAAVAEVLPQAGEPAAKADVSEHVRKYYRTARI